MDREHHEMSRSWLEEIIEEHCRRGRWALIPLIQEIQEENGYIDPAVIPVIAEKLKIFPSAVQGVISFYAQLYTEPRGRNTIRLCRGTACHVRGGKTILKLIKERLDIEEGETTADLEYTLETVACLGVCALAPSMMINQQVFGRMNPKKVGQILKRKGEDHEPA
jgi:NADH:ubiquinone oxidoreductase subunit E